MKPTILEGQALALRMIGELSKKTAKLRLQLAVVQVGTHAVSSAYIQKKKAAATSAGITFLTYPISAAASQKQVMSLIARIGQNPAISGIVVQLPLPAKFNTQEILDCIPPEKDPDVLSSAAFGRFLVEASPILPPTVAAVAELFRAYNIRLQGKRVALFGSGRLVGLPLMAWLSKQRVTVTAINKKTKNPALFTRAADIIISGVGKTKLVKSSMVKQGVVVIDLGTSVEQGKTSGDVDFKYVAKKARAITPVPGGVGPLTIACLLENLVTLSAWTSKS
ncbi:MAG: bifunctional 5,10-methylenetetrahydrofolate dehydrogenase/5,10-methenyltetrahydrofolate cyclohydrolase [Parcubacteria group bacterium]|nr:bifunctional 5,10-methylenetetrahydrofolate dehydrogenase/5,10-methenyltetrahydrofolate cyclohydrolase [Parcubacteria group bacterium]